MAFPQSNPPWGGAQTKLGGPGFKPQVDPMDTFGKVPGGFGGM